MNSSGKAWAVIVAGGKGRRFGSELPKQFAPLSGKPVLAWTLEPFLTHPAFAGVTVVLSPDRVGTPPGWLRSLEGTVLAPGGEARTDSVRQGLATVPAEAGWIAIHDGARPLITRPAISRVLEAARPRRGAVAGRKVTDSLKETDRDGRVVRALDRERLWRAETPQVFPRQLIVDLHREAEEEGFVASDDAALCERYGVEVVMVEISEPNLKITSAVDLDVAEAILERRRSQNGETGSASSSEIDMRR